MDNHVNRGLLRVQLILLLLLIIVAALLLRNLLSQSSAPVARFFRTVAWAVLALVVLYLMATGRLNWLLAAIGVTVAYLFRILPVILSHAPHLQRLWQLLNDTMGRSSQGRRAYSGADKMSADEAYQILGLKPGATEREIIASHRKLMQKNHPDHGGSDYLASKINLAKKTLLKK